MGGYLTTAEVAERLGLTPRRVRQLAGVLGGDLLAGRMVFPAARVEAFAGAPRPKAGYPKGRPRKEPPADPTRRRK